MSTTHQRRGLGVNGDPANGNDMSTSHERNIMLLDNPTALRILVAAAAVLLVGFVASLITVATLMQPPAPGWQLVEVAPPAIQEI